MESEIDLANVKSEQEDSQASLRPYEMLSYPADFTLEVLVDKWTKGEIKSPPQQRHYIWPIERASRLIESFLLNLPVPSIFLYQDRVDNSLLIVDGHQRLRSIACFFSGKFEGADGQIEMFNLTGLNEHSPFANVSFSQLKNSDPRSYNRLKDSVLRAVIMKQLQPADDTSIVEVFERLNTGGMPLQGQEVRNCIYAGPFNELLKALNNNANWRLIVGRKLEDKRMRDVELVLRFLALYHNLPAYKKPMKEFLSDFMKINRRPPPEPHKNDNDTKRNAIALEQKRFADKMQAFSKLFTQTAKSVHAVLGPKPFHVQRGLNAAVFDSVFVAFARHIEKTGMDSPSATQIDHIATKFRKLCGDKKYQALISSATTDDDVVKRRLVKAQNVLFG
jgi:hypothetical protein